MVGRVDSSVPADVKQKLTALLKRYSSVISKNEWDLGWTKLISHKIDTGNSRPVKQPMRRYPPVHQKAINKSVRDMLRQDVIAPCQSEWTSNPVIVRKKDGTFRCCIDYRQLNDVTRKDAYPLPRTDACLDALAGSVWYSTFDQRQGYHQLEVDYEDSFKTAFICKLGQFRFKRLPFGLTNAVASYQRLIDLVLSGLNMEICLAFLDDVILFSTTLEQHLERLEVLLQRLLAAGLKLKPTKCYLLQRKVTFLGHVVSEDGIATDPEKTRLIRDWPVPRNLKELRSYLGLTSYYRKFVKDYSKIAVPLTDLLKKDHRYVWTEDCQQAFDQLKAAFMSPPVLALPRNEGLMILQTDAADRSIGAILSQVQDGHERMVAYAGRTLNRAEQNYCTYRKELLAVVYFTKLFRQYLLGRNFKIRTDCSAITWLRKTKEPTGQNSRWMTWLEEYDYEVERKPASARRHVDAILRHPCLNKPTCTACHPERGKGQNGENDTVAANHTAATETGVLSQLELEVQVENGQGHSVSAAMMAENAAMDSTTEFTNFKWTTEELITAQTNDQELRVVMDLKAQYIYKPPWKAIELQSAATKSLWNEWERLFVKDGLLRRSWKMFDGATDRSQLILPRTLRSEFIRMVHSGMNGGHIGRSKTEHQV